MTTTEQANGLTGTNSQQTCCRDSNVAIARSNVAGTCGQRTGVLHVYQTAGSNNVGIDQIARIRNVNSTSTGERIKVGRGGIDYRASSSPGTNCGGISNTQVDGITSDDAIGGVSNLIARHINIHNTGSTGSFSDTSSTDVKVPTSFGQRNRAIGCGVAAGNRSSDGGGISNENIVGSGTAGIGKGNGRSTGQNRTGRTDAGLCLEVKGTGRAEYASATLDDGTLGL